MSFQYVYDSAGKAVGVFVPMNEWEKVIDALKKQRPGKKNAFTKDSGFYDT